jgi:hypothetical protein
VRIDALRTMLMKAQISWDINLVGIVVVLECLNPESDDSNTLRSVFIYLEKSTASVVRIIESNLQSRKNAG